VADLRPHLLGDVDRCDSKRLKTKAHSNRESNDPAGAELEQEGPALAVDQEQRHHG